MASTRALTALSQALANWNDATNSSGQKIPYRLVPTPSGQTPDISIYIGTTTATGSTTTCPNSALACQRGSAGNQTGEINLDPTNLTWNSIRDEDLKGRISHEIAHLLGENDYWACSMSVSIMGPTYPPTGQRNSDDTGSGNHNGTTINLRYGSNTVQAGDVDAVRAAKDNSSACTGDDRDRGLDQAPPTSGPGPGDGGGTSCPSAIGGCKPGGGGGWSAPHGCWTFTDCDGDGYPYWVDCDDLDRTIHSCETSANIVQKKSGGGNATALIPNQTASCGATSSTSAVLRQSDLACLVYCAGVGANACQWNVSNGICTAIAGTSCGISSGSNGNYALPISSTGRYKCGGGGSCSWDSTDTGPNQCLPGQTETCSTGGGGEGGGPYPGGSNLTAGTAVRGCSGYSWSTPVFKSSGDACYSHCVSSGADACEYQLSTGDCYAETGTNCHLDGGYSDWYSLVLSGTTGGGGGGGSSPSMTVGAVRGCYGSYWGPDYQPDAASCLASCVSNGADACEYEDSSGDCYIEFMNSGTCYIDPAWSGWQSAVLTAASAGAAANDLLIVLTLTLTSLCTVIVGGKLRYRLAMPAAPGFGWNGATVAPTVIVAALITAGVTIWASHASAPGSPSEPQHVVGVRTEIPAAALQQLVARPGANP